MQLIPNSVLWTCLLVMIMSCKPASTRQMNSSISKDQMIEANKMMVAYDAEMVNAYIERKAWNMTSSDDGYWYMIYEEGAGKKISFGDKVTFNYNVRLLDESLCYSSDSTGPKTVFIGKSDIESGLHIGLQLLKEGDKARFIFPPQLAFGLIGDRDKIPMRSIIIYDVNVIQVVK